MQDEGLQAIERLLATTRSVRRKLDFERPVEPELIEACIDLAVQAPTGAQAEAWRFLVVTDPDKKKALGDLYRTAFDRYATLRADAARAGGQEPPPERAAPRSLAERLHEFPVLIVACSEGRPGPELAQQVAFYGSILPAAWSLMLALRARGLGATWTTLHLVHADEAAQLLGIPAEATQTVLLPVAWLKDAVLRPAERKPAREVTYWNAWGSRRTS